MADGYTLEHAKEMLDLWMKCEKVLAGGTVKSYKIGNRELTRIDLKVIRQSVTYWKNQVDILSGETNGLNIRQVVFRDL